MTLAPVKPVQAKPVQIKIVTAQENSRGQKNSWRSFTVNKQECVQNYLLKKTLGCVLGCYVGLVDYSVTGLTLFTMEWLCGSRLEKHALTGGLELSACQSALGGIEEEFVFRGILQNLFYHTGFYVLKQCRVGQYANRAFVLALTTTSVMFGLAHLRNPIPSGWQSAMAGMSGFLYGSLSHYIGLEASASAHATFNFLGMGGLNELWGKQM